MQMQNAQGARDKVEFGAIVNGATLHCTCPPTEEVIAREILTTLVKTRPVGWSIDIQDSMLTIWCSLHDTLSYRMPLHWCGKGLVNVQKVAKEMVERIRAGAC